MPTVIGNPVRYVTVLARCDTPTPNPSTLDAARGFLVSLLLSSIPSLITEFPGAIQFVQNATQDYDYSRITTIPNGFGDGEFTLKVVITPSQVSTVGDTENSPGVRENWADETAEPYTSAEWWFLGNFLLDGHNNSASAFEDGTFSLQVYNSGYVRWTFGDGTAAGARTGDLHGIQNSSGTNILDGNRHVIHCVRRWSNSPANSADLELYVDGTLQDTENSTSRTNMATTYWDSWTGFPAAQTGWFFGAEKQAAIGDLNDYADYKGLVEEVTFYDGALSSGDISNDQGPVNTGHANYLDHFAFTEGSGTTTDSANGITMTLTNPGDFWP